MEHKTGSPNLEKGQALVEYSMILVVVAVVVVVILALLGPALSKTYNSVAASLGSPGTPTAVPAEIPPPAPTWTFCADEHQYCEFSGTMQVQYGANGTYAEMTFTGGTLCSNDIFGDPLYGTFKHCNIRQP